MSDHILRAITSDGLVQAAAISSRDLTERARQIHKTLPVATAALGRTLAGASMMGNALKGHGASLTLQIKGSGPLGTILAVSDSDGNVRGYVTNPQTELPLRPDGKLDVGGAVGQEGRRITQAKNLLRFTDMTVDEISAAIGMNDANYLARRFRKIEGMSPGEYRKKW